MTLNALGCDKVGRVQVEAMKRRDLYFRMSLLDRINEGTEKARNLVEQRSMLQEQRKTANMEASFQRQRLQAPALPRTALDACTCQDGWRLLFRTLLSCGTLWSGAVACPCPRMIFVTCIACVASEHVWVWQEAMNQIQARKDGFSSGVNIKEVLSQSMHRSSAKAH